MAKKQDKYGSPQLKAQFPTDAACLEIIFDAVVFDSGAPQDIVVAGGKKIRYPTDTKSDILIILGDNWQEKLIEFGSSVN